MQGIEPIITALNCLEYLMSHGGGVITVVADVASNQVVPVLCSSELERYHCKLHLSRPKTEKKNR